jgi:hypothetical protein
MKCVFVEKFVPFVVVSRTVEEGKRDFFPNAIRTNIKSLLSSFKFQGRPVTDLLCPNFCLHLL